MIVKLLTEHHLAFPSLKGDWRGSSESTLVKCHIAGNLVSRLLYQSAYESGTLSLQPLWCFAGPRLMLDGTKCECVGSCR